MFSEVQQRRKAILSGFTNAWLKFQVAELRMTTGHYLAGMCWAAKRGNVIDFEDYIGGFACEVITKCMFNFSFGSEITDAVKDFIAAFKVLEQREWAPFPYWKLPFVPDLVERFCGRQMNYKELEYIINALAERSMEDIAVLKELDYAKVSNPSMIRLFVELKGVDTTGKQIRIDSIVILATGLQTTCFEDIEKLKLVRLVVAETLRLKSK